MDTSNAWAVIAGAVVPVIVALITNTNTSAKVKGFLALALSVVAGVYFAWAGGQFDAGFTGMTAETVVKYVAVVAVSAQTAYNMFIKPSGLSQYLQLNWVNVTPKTEETPEFDV